MAIKNYKPTSPGKRKRKTIIAPKNDVKEVKRLKVKLSEASGRNNKGRVTVNGRSGGKKRKYRIIDFKRNKVGVQGVIRSIEHDPYRNAFISLVFYADGDKRYIITPNNSKIGDIINSGDDADIKAGHTLPLRKIPDGTIIHNLEVNKGKGAQYARAAGTYAVLQAKSGQYAAVKLPSGESRLVNIDCIATIGQVSNMEIRNTIAGKAGVSRWKGRRPKVRGTAKNPCDHPHGGGEGRAPIGMPSPKSATGLKTLGYKTRKKSRNKQRKRYVLRERS